MNWRINPDESQFSFNFATNSGDRGDPSNASSTARMIHRDRETSPRAASTRATNPSGTMMCKRVLTRTP